MKTGQTKKYAQLAGRLILSLVLVSSSAALIGFQWNDSHVFNPGWHPHARFHAVQLLSFGIAMSSMGLWLLWRRSLEPPIGAAAATTVPIIFWGAEFVALLVPGTSPSPDLNNPNTFQLVGFEVYGNLFFSGVMIALSALAYFLINRRG